MTNDLIEEVVRAILVNDPAVFAAVGERIYVDNLPEDATLPAIVFHVIAEVRHRPNATTRLRYSCYETSPSKARRLGNKVIDALDWYSGVVNGVKVIRIRYLTLYPWTDPDSSRHVLHADFRANYRI